MSFPKINLGPALKTSIGLVALIIGWFMLMNLLIGIWPDEIAMLKELRKRTSENLTIQSALLLQSGDTTTLRKTLEETVRRDKQINSLAIRTKEGKVITQVGNHNFYWKPISNTVSTLDFVRVELKKNQQPWGNLEIAYRPSSPKTIIDWLKQPDVFGIILTILGGIALYSFYLKRIFIYLDPSSVIPDRVSAAFDSFSEGVLMVDKTGRIMLANKTLRLWVEEENNLLFGKSSQNLPWLKAALREEPKNYPWIKAMETQDAINGWQIEFQKITGEQIKAVINCSPILDSAKNVRGCIVTFDNVTEIDKVNKELTSTMEKLYASQMEIEKQNTELIELATRDSLTSCLNRRAFFETAEKTFSLYTAKKQPLACIMADIDHFKYFNDRFGHAVGDKVIIAFSRTLFIGLRSEDLLCRYGGEEFCILLPDATRETALNIAERIRTEVELNAGASIRNSQDIKITSSFGVSFLSESTPTLAAIIDQADQALYNAKADGRNCVKTLN